MDNLIQNIKNRLVSLQVGRCSCCTKTPEIQYHDVDCVYRNAVEIYDQVKLLEENFNEVINKLLQPGAMVFLDGRNEHGSHVLPASPTNLPQAYEEILPSYAEEIIIAAETLGFHIGDMVWTEWSWNKPIYGDFGRLELAGYWEFKSVNKTITDILGKKYED